MKIVIVPPYTKPFNFSKSSTIISDIHQKQNMNMQICAYKMNDAERHSQLSFEAHCLWALDPVNILPIIDMFVHHSFRFDCLAELAAWTELSHIYVGSVQYI